MWNDVSLCMCVWTYGSSRVTTRANFAYFCRPGHTLQSTYAFYFVFPPLFVFSRTLLSDRPCRHILVGSCAVCILLWDTHVVLNVYFVIFLFFVILFSWYGSSGQASLNQCYVDAVFCYARYKIEYLVYILFSADFFLVFFVQWMFHGN